MIPSWRAHVPCKLQWPTCACRLESSLGRMEWHALVWELAQGTLGLRGLILPGLLRRRSLLPRDMREGEGEAR